MSVFIKAHAGEIFESRNSVKEVKSKVTLVSNKTREYLEEYGEYSSSLNQANNLLNQLKSDIFKLRSMLPEVPESVVPESRLIKKKEVEFKAKIKKDRNYHEELSDLQKQIEEL